jgi:hypothetical protein
MASKIDLIISGQLLMPAEGKTYDSYGSEVRAKYVLKKDVSMKKTGKAKKVIAKAEKLEKQMNVISQQCGNLQNYIARSAEKTRANKFKSMRG